MSDFKIRVKNGKDAPIPYIGVNGNWWINGADLGLPSQGVGKDGTNGTNGASVWVKYNTAPQDSGATLTWSQGKNYIGIQTAVAASAPSTGYMWALFIPAAAVPVDNLTSTRADLPLSARMGNLIDKRLVAVELATGILSLENFSWAEINSIAEQGKAAEYFAVGDEKKITLTTGETITMVILDFEVDTLTAGGKAKITFGMKNCLATAYPMNATFTVVGGWKSSLMRTSTMPMLMSQLPSELQSVIKTVDKGDRYIEINQDKLFLLTIADAHVPNHSASLYKYYAETYERMGKRLADGAGAETAWWLQTIWQNELFERVGKGGSSGVDMPDTPLGVSFAFCI